MKQPRGRKVPASVVDAMEAARNLNPEDLKKILDEKTPPTPEELQKDLVTALLEMAKQLPGEELSKLVESRQGELRALQILNVQRNVTSITLNKAELDGMLAFFSKLNPEQRKEATTQIQQAGVNAGIQQGVPLDTFAHKLVRIGLHL